jgi:hypothetical protein
VDDKLLAEVLSAFTPDSPNHHNLKDMDLGDPFAQTGYLCEQTFTAGVDTLRRFENAPIGNLMSYVWDIYHYHHVVVALGPDVPSLSIAVTKKGDLLQALTFVPHRWLEMIKEDPVMQLGALIFVGSQVTDYYNNRIMTRENNELSKQRATSYEAEYLRLIQGSNFKFNSYQESVLKKYPNGFDTSLAYERKPVTPMS